MLDMSKKGKHFYNAKEARKAYEALLVEARKNTVFIPTLGGNIKRFEFVK